MSQIPQQIIINLDDDFGEIPPQYPTPSQAWGIWKKNFEPLLLCSDEHNAELLELFEKDILEYVKKIEI